MLPSISDDYTPDEKYEILKIAATGFFSLSEAESLYNRFPNLVIRDKPIVHHRLVVDWQKLFGDNLGNGCQPCSRSAR